MELRDIEIFLTLAQELHFGRTAERLHVSPARVSQAIKQQERRIGTALFERTTRKVRLTPAGQQLYRELHAGYRTIMRGIETASATARNSGATLTLGTMGPQAWMVDKLVELFRSRFPDVLIDHRDINPVSPFTLLRSGEIDMAHLWLPVHEPDLTVGPATHTSAILLMLATTHPYADRTSVRLEDYGDLTFVNPTSPVPASMEAAFQPFRTPSGRPVPRGPEVSSWDDQVKAVASGQAALAVPAEAARFYAWPNLVYVPVLDAPPVRWAFAWQTSEETPLIRAFAQTVREHATLT
ncbi:LysR family transcriptional regulator [Nocardia cyriacigeorgica]|uniref:LysR family transcriptional regulator n=1 Tax=Nocardia cyriacigeorgica TaxID=135487 RepID=UPI0013D04125|nr:LysR family transcriptional regulator [Nocardia cyriacigeorgica]NEW27135.1 LysR family transcriptional regulator [Nocardia cyriacigeorgica]